MRHVANAASAAGEQERSCRARRDWDTKRVTASTRKITQNDSNDVIQTDKLEEHRDVSWTNRLQCVCERNLGQRLVRSTTSGSNTANLDRIFNPLLHAQWRMDKKQWRSSESYTKQDGKAHCARARRNNLWEQHHCGQLCTRST